MGRTKIVTKADALKKLREDWLAENSDDREEGVTKYDLTCQITRAKKALDADPESADKLYDLAHAYGVLDPCDKRCLNVMERMLSMGVQTMDHQRQGEAYQLAGRSLFLANRFEESLAALKKANICWKLKGNFKVRRQNNRALLRVHSALGNGKEAAERLEVALTLVEESDDSIFLYISAKSALEFTSVERDREVLDDIWYVYLDTHPETKAKFEGFQQTGEGVIRQSDLTEWDEEGSWEEFKAKITSLEVWREILPEAIEEAKNNPIVQYFFKLLMCWCAVYSLVLAMPYLKAKGFLPVVTTQK